MKHKVNPKYVPVGYLAITWFPWLAYYVSREAMKDEHKRHEEIHGRQQAELLILFFYFLYGLNYVILRLRRLSHSEAYRSICFEKEAYRNDENAEYLKYRKPFAWLKYL